MRRLIVCADGTWKTAEAATITNVTFIARAIAPVAMNGTPQVVFYDPGVGTGPWLDRISGGAFGRGLDENIKDVYRALVYNYDAGDQVFLFGFSRGAYTVRSALGMIRKCGLLRKNHADRLGEAYELYRTRKDEVDGPEAMRFRQSSSWPAFDIAFLGVWDTVGSLGIPLAGLRWLSRRKYQFHDPKLSRIVKRAYHAVAIDEKRRAFQPTLWETQPDPIQRVEQVWFAGVHSDVGGGYPDRGLADITFAWMANRAADAGIEFDDGYLTHVMRLDLDHPAQIDDANYKAPLHTSRTAAYLATPPHTRPIGSDPSHCESVWHTAARRANEPALDYHPENLVEYLARPDRAVVGPDGVPAGAPIG